jgi:hypothetical protein
VLAARPQVSVGVAVVVRKTREPYSCKGYTNIMQVFTGADR